MQFEYFAGAQRTKEWYDLRIGKVTASRLKDWLAVSKAKNSMGAPLKPRSDYERELVYERQFNVAYQNYVSDAMLDGIELEDFARRQYQLITDNMTDPCGAWYGDQFMASPDSVVYTKDDLSSGEVSVEEADGLLEIKIVRDGTFSQILLASAKDTHVEKYMEGGEEKERGTGVPEDHWKQIQGQLWASGKKYCDYVAVNLNTKKIKIIRVLPDAEFHEWLELAVVEPITVEAFSEENLYDIQGDIPNSIFNEATKEPATATGGNKGW